MVHFSNRLPSEEAASKKNLPTLVTRDESRMSRRDLKQTGSNTVPLGEAMGRLRLGGGVGGPSLLNPSYLGGGGGEFAGCDPGPLAGRDTPPPGGGVKELPTLKILVVDCKQGAVRAVRSVEINHSSFILKYN